MVCVYTLYLGSAVTRWHEAELMFLISSQQVFEWVLRRSWLQQNKVSIHDLSDLDKRREIRENHADLDYCNGTSQTVSRTTRVTHCSIPRMHLDMSKWADMGGSCFLRTLPGWAESSCGGWVESGRAEEGRRAIYAKMGGLWCFPNRIHTRVLLVWHKSISKGINKSSRNGAGEPCLRADGGCMEAEADSVLWRGT